jgi:hypothetical protein
MFLSFSSQQLRGGHNPPFFAIDYREAPVGKSDSWKKIGKFQPVSHRVPFWRNSNHDPPGSSIAAQYVPL